jgi:4-hydroxybenzoate polyprenyltransferase
MIIAPSALRTSTSRYLSRLRLHDILVLQGPPLLGAAFAITRLHARDAVSLLTLLAGNLFLMTHVFMLNDWAGLEDDLADPNKTTTVFTTRGIATSEIAALSAGLLIVSVLLFSSLGRAAAGIALAIAALSALYSLPPFHWKGRAVLSSATHLAGGILHFLLGYCVGHAIDRRGVTIAVYFALIFAAGHLTQEVRDHAGDAINRIGTNAVTFGARRTFITSLLLFTCANLIFLRLALDRMIPRPLAVAVVLFLFQIYWSFETMRDGLTYANVSRLQSRYRMLYGFIGACIFVALVIARRF